MAVVVREGRSRTDTSVAVNAFEKSPGNQETGMIQIVGRHLAASAAASQAT